MRIDCQATNLPAARVPAVFGLRLNRLQTASFIELVITRELFPSRMLSSRLRHGLCCEPKAVHRARESRLVSAWLGEEKGWVSPAIILYFDLFALLAPLPRAPQTHRCGWESRINPVPAPLAGRPWRLGFLPLPTLFLLIFWGALLFL